MQRYFDCTFDGIQVHHSLTEHPDEKAFLMHAHDTAELYYFISGYCRYSVEGQEYVLKPGDVMLMRPSETHSLKVMGDMPYERVVIQFDPKTVENFDRSGVLLKPFFERPLGKLNRLSEEDFDGKLYRRCFESLTSDSPVGLKLETEAKLLTVLCEVAKAFASKKTYTETDTAETSETVTELIKYINENLYEPLSLSSLSDKFFLSQSQLGRLFKRATGTSVWEYITIKRLIAARNRIRVGDHAGDVCTACGFKDYSSFYRMYKSRFGVSPKQDDLTKSKRK